MRRAGVLPHGLYLITPDMADTEALVTAVEAVLPAAPVLLQYRNKSLDARERMVQAAELRTCCRAAGVAFIVNDDVALALDVDADGVHLGRADGDLQAARRRLGAGRHLGVSCYNEWPRALAAAEAGADYVAFGAVFPSPTKPDAVVVGLDLITRARAALSLGVVAIGGIALDNAPTVIDAGATHLAVISDIFDAAEPLARAKAYGALFAPAYDATSQV